MKLIYLTVVLVGCSEPFTAGSISDAGEGGESGNINVGGFDSSGNTNVGGYDSISGSTSVSNGGAVNDLKCSPRTTRCAVPPADKPYLQSTEVCSGNGVWLPQKICSGESGSCVNGECTDTCEGTCTYAQACNPSKYMILHQMNWVNTCVNHICECVCPGVTCNVGSAFACGSDC